MPCFGVREFPALFSLLEAVEPTPSADAAVAGSRDLGWMLHDIDFDQGNTSRFFRAHMQDGVITIPQWHSDEVKS